MSELFPNGTANLDTRSVRLASLATLARELDVTLNQVTMWHARRASNGFPESLGRAEVGEGLGHRMDAKVWDLNAVLEWRESYVPAKGGRRSSGER
jgi:hypothetical protein